MVYDAATDDAHVFRPVYDEPGFHDGTRSQVDSTVRWNLDFLAGQVLRLVHARTEVDEAGAFHEHVLRVWSHPVDGLRLSWRVVLGEWRVCQHMQVVQAVAAKLHAEVFRSVEAQ